MSAPLRLVVRTPWTLPVGTFLEMTGWRMGRASSLWSDLTCREIEQGIGDQPDPIVTCPRCGSPVRWATALEVTAALLSDGPAPDVTGDCLWCGPRGVGREHPPHGPVPLCAPGIRDGDRW